MQELKTGDKAPQFVLRDQNGEDVALSDYVGVKVLVYFYPKASTPGCTAQSCAVRDALGDLGKLGVKALGISPDEPQTQRDFDEEYGLGFPLLCDTDHSVADAWGVWGEKSMYGNTYLGVIRSAFLVDEDGRIEEAWSKVSPKDTVPNVMKQLADIGSSD